ncbi:MAG: transposase [Cyanobium sp.]
MAPLLDGSSAGELIPELTSHGLQQLIELEVAAFLGAERHERTDELLGYRNGYRPGRLHPSPGASARIIVSEVRTGAAE